MKIYVIVTTENYVPDVFPPTFDKQEALKKAKDYASVWDPKNTDEEPSGSQLYFSQEEDGNMDQSVTLFELEIEIPA